MNTRISSFLLFLIGTFSHTQIYIGGAIGISELFVFALAPVLFLQDYAVLKRDGFMLLIGLVFLSLCGCFLSCRINQVVFRNEIRGVMANYGLFASIVVFHRLLRNNLRGVRWFLLGVAISLVISTFVFHGATEFYMYSRGDERIATEAIMNSPLFWTARLGSFWTLPYSGWYMHTPQFWNYISAAIWGIVSLLYSQGSGRASSLTLLCTAALFFVCGKSQKQIQMMSRNIGIYLLLAIPVLFILTGIYRYTASHGLLGEKAQAKYEFQVQGRRNPLQILMAGRGEFFVGLMACFKRPLFGYGPWALDTDGIYEDWLKRFGDADAVDRYYEYQAFVRKYTGMSGYRLIPAHSVMIQFWLWYGLGGLILWIYVLYCIWRYLRHDMDAIPHLIGYLLGWIPMYLWNIFFSPFGGRLEYGSFLAALLLCTAVKKGIVQLPNSMIRDIIRANREN